MYQLTLNILISLIVQAKITGKGKLGNGRIFIRLLSVIVDCNRQNISKERDMLALFNSHADKQTAYQQINRFLFDFIWTGGGFPVEKITMQIFENKLNLHGKTDWKAYRSYLAEMGEFCEQVLDKEKIPAFMNTLLMLMKQDDNIQAIFYGGQFISKNSLSGTAEHPKKVCLEALLLGLLYQTLKKFAPGDAERTQLFDSEKLSFQIIQLGTKENPVFWGDCEELKKILNPKIQISVKENLEIHQEAEKGFCYPLRILCRKKERLFQPQNGFYPSLFDYQEKNHIFLHASGGAGKSFLLQHQDGLYLSLAHYREEIRQEIHPEISCYILVQILLKYHYHYAYQTYDLCAACEEPQTLLRQFAELLNLFRKLPENQIPEYTLLLDGINEMSPGLQDVFAEELEYICNEWHNTRILLSGRIIPHQDIFAIFEKIEITGIPEHFRNELLSEWPEVLRSQKLLDILKTPLFMKYFLETRGTHDELNTRGEILDAYFTNEIKKYKKPLQFAVKYAVPILAHSLWMNLSINRSAISDAVKQAFLIYVEDEHIYQNFTASDHFRKEILLNSRDVVDFAELLIEKTGIFKVVDNKLQFSHWYIYEYFAAKYILNAIHTAESGCTQDIFEKLLNSIWHSFDDNIYLFIGEICGDYRNIPDKNGILDYHRTELDTLLDMARTFHINSMLNEVVHVMALARNRLICNVDFSGLFLSGLPIHGLKFSDDGNYPSDFHGCRVLFLPDVESRIFCAAYSSDGRQLLLGMDDSHVILWDVRAGRVLKDYPLHAYLKYPECLDKIEFLNHDAQFIVLTRFTRFLIETKTGKILSIQSENHSFPHLSYASAFSPDNQHFLIDNIIYSATGERKKIQFPAKSNHFKNCDFRNLIYFSPRAKSEIQETLHESGAVTG